MCGIAGALGDQDSALVPAMTEALHHRGPDATGHHSGAVLRMGSRRLSVISYPPRSLSACQRKCSAMNVEMK